MQQRIPVRLMKPLPALLWGSQCSTQRSPVAWLCTSTSPSCGAVSAGRDFQGYSGHGGGRRLGNTCDGVRGVNREA
jgi:hypothetical protein